MKHLILLLFNILLPVAIAAQSFSLISWNIQDFGQTKNEEEMLAIAKIVKDFDIVAIQEVVAIHPGGAQAVARLVDQLNRMGTKWDYRISDPTSSPGRRVERYAYLWKTSKVTINGRPWLDKEDEPTIYREPYLARFSIKGEKVLIVNYHSRTYKDGPDPEIKCFYKYPDRFQNERIIIAGDFNTYPEAPVFIGLKNIGFLPSLNHQKTTLKKGCGENGEYLYHPIDYIFYAKHQFNLLDAGVVDFVQDCNKLDLARQLSDHLPVWSSFDILH
ncbi:MAG: deoxyribonuclease-1-like protein [Saprospiraceae bacterium]|jgi:deoxyribonuclease-1-like protein